MGEGMESRYREPSQKKNPMINQHTESWKVARQRNKKS